MQSEIFILISNTGTTGDPGAFQLPALDKNELDFRSKV